MAMADCVIVGAGLIGMLTAAELAAGGMQVTILERGQPARESSWAGGGILSPLYPWRYPDSVSELARWSQRYYPEFCRRLAAESGIDPQWTLSGLMIADIEEREAVQRWAHQMEALGAEVKGVWLVDFDNGTGYYCWKWPEEELAWFHTYEDGFGGRVRIH